MPDSSLITVDLEADGTESVLPPYQMSVTTRHLIDRLKEMKIGEIVTFRELTTLVGTPVNSSSSHLRTAMKRVLKDYNIVLKSVPTKGYRRLSNPETIIDDNRYRRKHIRNAQRAESRLGAVDPTVLGRDEQMMLCQKKMVHRLIKQTLSRKNIRQIDKAIAEGIERRSGSIQVNLKTFLQGPNA